MKQFRNAILALSLIGSTFPVFSQDLDNTFGTDGKSVLDINNQLQGVNTIKIQTDNKLLVCGKNFGPDQYAVIRLNTDGTLDNTFSGDGTLTFDVPGADEGGVSNTMTLQSDGKILLGGSDYDGTLVGAVVVRINSDGTFDNAFGTSGFKRFNIGADPGIVHGLLVLPDGKIIAIGEGWDGTASYVFVVKLNSDGSFDTSFDTDGIITFAGLPFDNLAVLQSDNKILLGNPGYIVRINTDGTFDNTFGTNGKIILSDIELRGIIVLESGKIGLAGLSAEGFSIGRLNTDGTFDNTFGSNGLSVVNPSGLQNTTQVFRCIAEDTSNNHILAGGYVMYSAVRNMVVAEFLPDGTLDNYVTIGSDQVNNDVFSLQVQADRKVVAAGVMGDYADDDVSVLRLNADFSTYVATDVSKQQFFSGFNLFPNPASQYINIHSSYSIERIQVLDVLGNEVFHTKPSGNKQIDISFLPKGLYNFIITTDQGVGTKKVSVQ